MFTKELGEKAGMNGANVIWRGSIRDFVSDLLSIVGDKITVRMIGNDIAYRVGTHPLTTEIDRAAAINWTYGKPAFEMDEAFQKFVKHDVGDAKIPQAVERLATAFAEVRAELAKGEG
jgi:hypothetical protein